MKKTLVVLAVAAVMLFAMASTAFAGNTEGTSGISEWVSNESIHSGYATSTNACKVCHDVHNNAGGEFKLFISEDINLGCDACHAEGAGGIEAYLSTQSTAHSIDGGLIPDSTVDFGSGAGIPAGTQLDCLDCHDAAPHGAGAPSPIVVGLSTEAASMTDFCLRCHDLNDGRLTAGERAVKTTHVMVAKGDAYTEYGAATAADADDGTDSSTCQNCHVSNTDFPHTGNYKLLNSTAGFQALDTVCRDCHADGVGTHY